MTLQPEKEYIITESCIVSAENNLFSFRERKKEWATDIRARPHSNATERDKLLDEICMRCPCLDWRPDNCENCLVGTMKAELRTPTEAQR